MGSCGAGGMTSSTGGSGDALRHAERFKICASSVEALKSGLTALLALEIEIGFEKRPWTPRGCGVQGKVALALHTNSHRRCLRCSPLI